MRHTRFFLGFVSWVFPGMLSAYTLITSPKSQAIVHYLYDMYTQFGEKTALISSADLSSLEEVPDSAIGIYVVSDEVEPWQPLLQRLPVRFHGDTIWVQDSMLVAEDWVFAAKFPYQGKAVEVYIARNVRALSTATLFPYPGHPSAYSFSLARARDGIFYTDDATAIGLWHAEGNRMVVDSLQWIPHDPLPLENLVEGPIALFYDADLLKIGEARKVARLLATIYDAYEALGLSLPDTVYAYVYQAWVSHRRWALYSNAYNTFWHKVRDKRFLLNPEDSKPILGYAHEMARLSLQPLCKDPDKGYLPWTLGADDWSHFGPMIGVIPYVHQVLGDSAWLVPYDYLTLEGPALFRKIYHGAQNTFAWILYEIDSLYGRPTLVQGIREWRKKNPTQLPDIEEFVTAIAKKTQDPVVLRQAQKAMATPFEHTLSRWKRWKPLGFFPPLERMFFYSDFEVDSVDSGSVVWEAGLRAGDVLVAVNGYPVETQKADAYRSLLFLEPGGQFTVKVRRPNGKIQTLTITPERWTFP